MTDYRALNDIILNSKYLVFFGGAGVSTESGIPDFRSKDGLYNKNQSDVPAEVILSRSFFDEHKEEFYDFYFKYLVNENVLPNIVHKKLALLEEKGILKAIVTQNIDGLHEMAGSKCVLNLHGTIYKNHCMDCNKYYSLNEIRHEGVPKCTCGGVIKPDVTLYEEALDQDTLNDAIKHISKADTLIIGGTSLSVYPAAGLIHYFNGKNLIIINKDHIDVHGCLMINEYLGEVFNKIEI